MKHILSLLISLPVFAAEPAADVCIYGGTSGAIIRNFARLTK